ncbi:MAG: ABC transporter ATP-binding protein, partial [Candidatus Altiarchaeota archaeon]
FSLYRTVAGRLSELWGFRTAEQMSLDVKVSGMKHLFSLDLSWHESEYAGSKVQRVINGANGMRNLVRLFYTDLLPAAISIFGAAAVMFSLSWELSVALLAFAATYYILSLALIRKASKQVRVVQKKSEAASGVNYESVGNIAIIKVMDLAEPIMRRVERVNTEYMDESMKVIKYFRLRQGVTTVYAVVLKFLMLLYISYGIYHGTLEIGVFVMFYIYFDLVLNATAGMSRVTDQVIEEKVAVGRLRELLELKPTVEVSGSKPMNTDWNEIEVRGLTFSYAERETLHDISFKVKRGERIGVVGPTGAGKSTLFKLMLKLDERYEGDIFVDGVRLRDIDRKSYMQCIAVVPQDTEVFNATLRENIEIVGGCGKDLKKAIDMANLGDLVGRLPQGVDTVVGEKGVKLSGGEKQRLSIARAFYKCPQMIFLDEPTSQLDANSELRIQDSLRRVFSEVTAIVIAHRLSTIQEMDRILVVDGGRIVEEGTFNELINKKGLFHELWEKQRL